MSGQSCHFCARPNPPGSKFCNDCGEPLDLKPCSRCDAFNHVAVDRCYQCGAPFTEPEAVAVAEVGAGAAAESAPLVRPRPAPPRAPRIEPSLGPLERVPVALSDRMEAATERIAEPVGEAPPLKAFAEAAPDNADTDDDLDWVDPRRERAARAAQMRVRRRARAGYAVLAAAVLAAIGVAGLYAYDAGMASRAVEWVRGAERTLVASSSAIVSQVRRDIGRVAPAASPSPLAGPSALPAAAPPAAAEAPPAAAEAPTGSAPSQEGVSSPPAPATAAPRAAAGTGQPASMTSPPPVPQSSTADPAPTIAPASRSPTGAATRADTASSKAVPATREGSPVPRRTSREIQAKPVRAKPPRPSVDKDALATQRLIERDLAGFLPPERSVPASPR